MFLKSVNDVPKALLLSVAFYLFIYLTIYFKADKFTKIQYIYLYIKVARQIG